MRSAPDRQARPPSDVTAWLWVCAILLLAAWLVILIAR